MIIRADIPRDVIADFCRRHYIQRLSLFGSSLRDDFSEHSDVDVLYTFEPDHVPGWEIVDIEYELSAILGRKVDMVPERHLNPRIRDQILASAEVIYAKS